MSTRRRARKRPRSPDAKSSISNISDDDGEEEEGATDDTRFHIGEIKTGLVTRLLTWLTQRKKEGCVTPLITIDSDGGHVCDALAVADLLNVLPVEVDVLVLGRCWSAAVAIFLAVPKRHRFALPSATFMIHFGESSVTYSSVAERAAEMEHHTRQDNMYDKLLIQACHTNKVRRSLSTKLRAHTPMYFSCRQVQDMGWMHTKTAMRCAQLMAILLDGPPDTQACME